MPYASPDPLTFAGQAAAGKVLFVTGASSGIGAAAVRRLRPRARWSRRPPAGPTAWSRSSPRCGRRVATRWP